MSQSLTFMGVFTLASILSTTECRAAPHLVHPADVGVRVEGGSDVLLHHEPDVRLGDGVRPDMVVQRADKGIRTDQRIPRVLCRTLGLLRRRRAGYPPDGQFLWRVDHE